MNQKKLLPLGFALALLGVAHGQSLHGKIILSAPPKPGVPHQVAKHQNVCGAQIPNEALLAGKKLELANAVIFVANLKPEPHLPHAVIPLAMENCAFKPRVLAALAGDTLLLRNRDAALHDARGELHPFRAGWDRQVTKDLFQTEAGTAFNFVFPESEAAATAVLAQPGLLQVRSTSGYDGMQAFILVIPHRAFAVSNAKGEFVLPRLPGGKYDLVLWHEVLGVKRQLAEVPAGKASELLLTWEIPEALQAPTAGVAAEIPPATARVDSTKQQ